MTAYNTTLVRAECAWCGARFSYDPDEETRLLCAEHEAVAARQARDDERAEQAKARAVNLAIDAARDAARGIE